MDTEPDITANLFYREWSALEGSLQFRFMIDRELSDAMPTLATVFSEGASKGHRADSEKSFQIVSTDWTSVNLEFDTGIRVIGRFIQKNNVLINGENSIAIFVDVEFGTSNQELQHFEGVMVYCGCTPVPQPPSPPCPPAPPSWLVDDIAGDPVSPMPVISAPSERLFPYVYMRQWSALDLEAFSNAFIQYADTSPPDPFIADLAQSKTQAGRDALSWRFITGDPPFAGLFIAYPRNLNSPVARFSPISERLHVLEADPQSWLAYAENILLEVLAIYNEPKCYYTSTEYNLIIERAWQSYFALVTLNEYSSQLRDEMARILFVAHLVQFAFRECDGELVRLDLDDKTIRELRSAMVVLPEFIFERKAKIIASDGSWGAPIAIGDLQLVRQQLKGYVPGEIARIETVMPGERREVQNRRLRQTLESDQLESIETSSSIIGSDDERDSLERETQKTLSDKTKTKGYDNYTTSYGPPTVATLNGTATTKLAYGNPARSDDVSRFARRILSNSVARLSRSVRASRGTAALFESEQLVSSIVDNSHGQHPIQAVYRWLNKVYEAQVVNYGRRLMVEFSIAQPARNYIELQAGLSGSALSKPLSPRDAFGLQSFEGITRSNYAAICGAYNVTDMNPPPPEHIYIGTTLRGDDEQQLSVPSGYQTVEAVAEYTSYPTGQLPCPILVGSVKLQDGVSTKLPAYSGSSALPVSSAAPVPSLQPLPSGSPPKEAVVTNFLINVEIRCEPTIERMNEWKISVYRAVIQAYRAMADSYYDGLDQPGVDKGSSLNPQYELQTERCELKAQCIDLMITSLEVEQEPRDLDRPGANLPAYRSLYQQFLAAALEWHEMTYTFNVNAGTYPDSNGVRGAARADQGSPFSEFLQAYEARVLVPVCPHRLRSFLYFWSSGRIWQGADWLVPVYQDDIALVVDAERDPGVRDEIEVAKWPMLIPTAMQVLDDGTSGISIFPLSERLDLSDV